MHALCKDPEGERVLNSTAAGTATSTAVTKEAGSNDKPSDSELTVQQLLLKVKQLESEILLLKVGLFSIVAIIHQLLLLSTQLQGHA